MPPAVIERFTKNTRFCIICNYVSKIIPALQSRCTRFRFGPLSKEQMRERTRQIIAKEGCVGAGWGGARRAAGGRAGGSG